MFVQDVGTSLYCKLVDRLSSCFLFLGKLRKEMRFSRSRKLGHRLFFIEVDSHILRVAVLKGSNGSVRVLDKRLDESNANHIRESEHDVEDIAKHNLEPLTENEIEHEVAENAHHKTASGRRNPQQKELRHRMEPMRTVNTPRVTEATKKKRPSGFKPRGEAITLHRHW